MACFEADFEACIAHLKLPVAHRRVTRTTNSLERLFGEERRRTKVIPHAFGERAVMKLMFAALMRASQTWRLVATKVKSAARQWIILHFDRHAAFVQRIARAPTGHAA